jgi:hypothetical protein
LARSLSNKDQQIQDLKKALTEQRESSVRKISEIVDKLKVLFEEYERSLNEFGVCPAPLPADLGLREFMDWMPNSRRFPKSSLVLTTSQQPSPSRAF